jgi:tetratricopeptide (TPR) repeat protein
MSAPGNPLDDALRLHMAGRLGEAVALYEQILAGRADNAQALFLLGTAYLQGGRPDLGAERLARSIAIAPDNPDAHNNLAEAFKAAGRPEDALKSYDNAIALLPDYADAHYNRANVLGELGRDAEALEAYRRALALQPNFAEAQNNLGAVLKKLGRADEALQSYDNALALQPGYAEAHFNRAKALHDLGRLEDALAAFDRALALTPQDPQAHYGRANALARLGRPEDAVAAFERALALAPDLAEAHNDKGVALRALKRDEAALGAYDRALALDPDFAEAWYNRANVLRDLGSVDDALAAFDKAIALKPDYADAHHNRGDLLAALGRYDDALTAFARALEIQPGLATALNSRGNALRMLLRLDEALAAFDAALAIDADYAEAHWNRALLLILMGRYGEGWAEYEWRQRTKEWKDGYPVFPKLAWRGEEDLKGKTLLIHAEQGLGDLVQFCRYAPMAAALGADVVLQVYKPLHPLVSTLKGGVRVIPKGEALPAFDAYIPVMSLPFALGTTLETVPSDTPYLFADAAKADMWRKKLGSSGRRRVGLVWAGAKGNTKLAFRSVGLEDMLPLFELPIEWHSLQKEYRDGDLERLARFPDVRQHQDDLGDFADTATLIECLDLVVAIDTSVAHVTGALGKPVWILLPYESDYRWMVGREDSPWYPTARLFRQRRPGDWAGVVKEVAEALTTN